MVAIIGAGAQGRRHLELLLELHPEIEEVRTFDILPAASEALLAMAGDRRGVAATSPVEAVTGADVVITVVTVTLSPRLTCDESAPDAVLLPVDYDDGIGPQAVNDAVLYVVDDIGQYHANVGEHFDGFREPDGELAQVVAGSLSVPAAGGERSSTWGSRWTTSRWAPSATTARWNEAWAAVSRSRRFCSGPNPSGTDPPAHMVSLAPGRWEGTCPNSNDHSGSSHRSPPA